MSFFTPQTKIVEIDGENTVTVRKLNYGERQSIISQCTKVAFVAVERDGKQDMEQTTMLDVGLMKGAQLRAAILTWEGPDFEGRPVSPDNVNALPPEICEKIEAGIEGLNKPLDEAEKK